MRRLPSTITAVLLAATLSACGGPGAAPADPSEAVAQGLDARFEEGFDFDIALELTDAGRDSMREDNDDEALRMLEDGLISGAYQPPDRMSLSLGGADPWFEFRIQSEALFVRIDLDGFTAETGEDVDLPSTAELQAMFRRSGVSAEVTSFVQAALEGRWVGITGLTEEAIQNLGQSFGMPPQTPDAQASEDIRDALERAGLLDGEQLTERYLIVAGGDGAYEVEVRARALVTALLELSRDAEQYTGGFTPTDLPDPDEVPEQIGGLTITLDDANKADLLTFDLVEIVGAFDPGAVAEDNLSEGDIRLVVDLDDLDPTRIGAPEGAVTMEFEALIGGLLPLFMGFLGGGGFGTIGGSGGYDS